MSIDWITVAAQIINFLVLVWLLKRFLYRPILDGIDAREKEIADRMAEASTIQKAAETTEADYQVQIAALSASRAEMLEEARRAAKAEADSLLAKTRKKVAKEQADRDAERLQETSRYTNELQQVGASALMSLTRKVLSDLADETLEQRMAIHGFQQMKPIIEKLDRAAGNSKQAVLLTREALPTEICKRLTKEFSAMFPNHEIQFKTNAKQSQGVTLRLGGAQVDWTIDSYIDSLEDVLENQKTQRLLKAQHNAA